MALRRNRRGDGADERASWGGGGAAPVSARPIGAPAGEDATARIVPAAPAVPAMPAPPRRPQPPGPQQAASGATAALAGIPHPEVPGPADPLRTADLVDAEALADMQAFNDLKARRKKQKRKKIIIGAVSAVAVLAVAGGAFAWYTADQAAKALQDRAPQTGFVEQGTFTETVSASGNLQPVASVSATPEVDGIVGEVLVAEGDAVAEADAVHRSQRRAGQGGEAGCPGHRGSQERRGPGAERRERRLPRQVRRTAGRRGSPGPGSGCRRGHASRAAAAGLDRCDGGAGRSAPRPPSTRPAPIPPSGRPNSAGNAQPRATERAGAYDDGGGAPPAHGDRVHRRQRRRGQHRARQGARGCGRCRDLAPCR